jgi:membrane fusion protein (multidrug efflux system)
MRTKTIGALLILAALCGCKKKPPPTPPPQVQVMTVQPQDVPVYQEWIGTLASYPNAQIRAQVTGYLIKQDYAEGSTVKQGQLLFEIDPRPFQAVLDQALARLAQDKAQQGKTQIDVKRYAPLAKEQAISQQEMDNAVQADLGAKAALKADEAAVQSAQLNLSFCRITSPIDGVAGIAQAQIGDLVAPGGTVLTTVSSIDPMRVYFNLSEETYLEFNRRYTNSAARTQHEDQMPLQLILSDGSVYPHPGKWFFTDRQINPNTGTLEVAALFPNPDYLLRPGQYAKVRGETEVHHGAIVVPQRAVTELQGSYQVVVVGSDNKAQVKTVQVGDQVGADWVIDSGLAANDRVVVEGAQKASKDGTVVDPQPYQGPLARK